jgi:methylated-DNA-[protein]-cysteine S-methyltransferase
MKLATATIETPLGRYALVASEVGLVAARPAGTTPPASGAASAGAKRMLARARTAFERYFAGAADALAALPVDPHGSEFQRRVWRALREIPLGATASYGEIAQKVGSPGAARAVGDANRRNPIAIAIPCHRVIGGNGSLVGYAGGLERKRWLLAHEAACVGYAASSNGPEGQLPVALARRRISAAASI